MLPRMRQIFLERANTETQAFAQWFRKSQVVDDSGQPAVVYHGTDAVANFDVFRQANDMGHHFGSQQAAMDRLKNKGNGEMPERSRVYPVFLSIHRPLWLDDMKTWEPSEIVRSLQVDRPRRDGWQPLSQQEADRVLMRPDKQSQMLALVKLLQQRGYDGIRYRNSIEDPTSVSWVAFEPGQIKSVYNRGTWDRKHASIME